MESGLVEIIGAVIVEEADRVLVQIGETRVWLPRAEVKPLPADDE